MDCWILGVSYGFHDGGIALLKNGEIMFAAQEERYTRRKQDPRFPKNALKAGMTYCGISFEDLAGIYYYEDSALKFQRICKTYEKYGLKGWRSFFADYPPWKEVKRDVKTDLLNHLETDLAASVPREKVHCIQHHFSHAASAFYPSPFEKAAVLCIDGVGEWATTSAWLGDGNTIDPVWEIHFPHSLGLLYSSFTQYCGFKVDSGEYKVMGLAPYGKPIYADLIREKLFLQKPDGSFCLNMRYFDFEVGNMMINDRFAELFGGPARVPESALTEREFDLAASVQVVVEEAVISIARNLREETGMRHLCLAGGVALNCVANGKLLRTGIFDDIWVQPASGDCGGALGAALVGWHRDHDGARVPDGFDTMKHAYLGTEYSKSEIGAELERLGAVFDEASNDVLFERASAVLAEGNVVGWFQGRMEFGPRALGGRSILGDPRVPDMQTKMNLKIKYRESFRPFAPVVLESKVSEWFEIDRPSPYMLMVADVQKSKRIALSGGAENAHGLDSLKLVRSEIPAVTHVDLSARIQTVSATSNERLFRLITAFEERTGCPVLINTSFNVRGEPIVESVENAYNCFMRTEMDYLVIGDFILKKDDQPFFEISESWKKEFVLD